MISNIKIVLNISTNIAFFNIFGENMVNLKIRIISNSDKYINKGVK